MDFTKSKFYFTNWEQHFTKSLIFRYLVFLALIIQSINKIMKSKNAFTLKAFLIAALFFTAPIAKAQNLVKNGSLENGFTTCHKNGIPNNGPFYLGENLVDDWYGQNYGAGSSNHPTNSGAIYDNTATCNPGKFPTGVSAYAGDRSAQVRVSYDVGNDALYGSWARGNLTSTLAEGCYWICIATNNQGAKNIAGIVEVVLASSTSSDENIIMRYIIPANSGWKKHKGYFKLLPSEGNKYDRVKIRMDDDYLKAHATATNHINDVLIDDVSLASCTSDPGLEVADGDFTLDVNVEPVTGGDAPVITTVANSNDDLFIHRWDIYVSNDQHDLEDAWVHLDGNSETVLEDANFNSGTLELTSEDKYYRLFHLIVNPCYGWAIHGKLVEVKSDGSFFDLGNVTISDLPWEPAGDEFDDPDPLLSAFGPKADKPGEAKKPMFEIWPNPPVNTITITPTEHNDAKLDAAKCVVYDSKGAVVIPLTNISENNTINISALSTGVYYIHVTNSEKMEIQKFIKE